MFGPKDVDGECNARLKLADDFGDNPVTFRCGLKPDHEGLHEEGFDSAAGGWVTITWGTK